MTGFQLRQLRVTGAGVPDATIAFSAGLNVVSGASDTGKSYLVETIDFMLGGGTPPRQIPESRGYDTAHLQIWAQNGKTYELSRALQGGDFSLLEIDGAGATDTTTLAPRHSAGTAENISTFLLRLIGLEGKRIRKNALNELQNLSFRNLAHLVIIDEETIIKKGSPVFGTESTQRTMQASVFKLLLTGQDDSALIAARKPAIVRAELEAKLAVLDQLLGEYQVELDALAPEPTALQDQLDRLTISIERSERALASERTAFEEQERTRQTAWQTRDEIRTRYGEIVALLERFSLLDEHYGSDLDRLGAVAEAGFFFTALDAGRCPLCGAPAGDHRHAGEEFDGDVESTRIACEREIAKVLQLRAELALTVRDLREEQATLRIAFDQARATYRAADALVRETLAPALSAARTEHSRLLERRAEVRQAISLRDRIADLREKRMVIETALSTAGPTREERPGLPPAAVQKFSAGVEALLEAWLFPHEKPVYFDEKSQDLILGNRRRGEQGKGLRALTHAAFSIGLLEASRALNLPSVGFVVLDSPLVTFREPDAEEAGLDAGAQARVKQAFYRDLATRSQAVQILIFENEDPDIALRAEIVSHIFTKRADQGRAGYFPIPASGERSSGAAGLPSSPNS